MLEAVSAVPNETGNANAHQREYGINCDRHSNVSEGPVWTCILRAPDRGRKVTREEVHRPDRRRRNEQPEALIPFDRNAFLARLHHRTFFTKPKGNRQ